MARQRSGDKLGDIRTATLAEVVDVGSAAASVNAIARRAGLAVGTLYRYHPSKDDLLRAVHLSIKADMHDRLMAAAGSAAGSADKIRAMWFALLEFARAEPQAFLFAEVIMNDALLTADDRAQVAAMAAGPRGVIAAAMDDGTLRRGDISAVVTLLTAPALQLGRGLARGVPPPGGDGADEVFALCWRAIRA